MSRFQVAPDCHVVILTPIEGAEPAHRLHGPGDVLPGWYVDQDGGLAARIEAGTLVPTDAPEMKGLPPRPTRGAAPRDPYAPPPASIEIEWSGLSPTGGSHHLIQIALPACVRWADAAERSRAPLRAVVEEYRHGDEIRRLKELAPRLAAAKVNLSKFALTVATADAALSAARLKLSKVDMGGKDAVKEHARLTAAAAEAEREVASASAGRDQCQRLVTEIESEIAPLVRNVRGGLRHAIAQARECSGQLTTHRAACDALAAKIAKQFAKDLDALATEFAAIEGVSRYDDQFATEQAELLLVSALGGERAR